MSSLGWKRNELQPMRNLPEFIVGWRFGGADQFIGDGAQEVVATSVPQRPPTARFVADDNFETGAVVLLLTFASDVAKLRRFIN